MNLHGAILYLTSAPVNLPAPLHIQPLLPRKEKAQTENLCLSFYFRVVRASYAVGTVICSGDPPNVATAL